jgi:hypothetical protein
MVSAQIKATTDGRAKSSQQVPNSGSVGRRGCSLKNQDASLIQKLKRLELQVFNFQFVIFQLLVLLTFTLFFSGSAQLSAAEQSPLGPSPGKARILLVTGTDYPGHLWRQTAPVLSEALRKDQRLEVFTVEDPQFLDSSAVLGYDLIILHFQNWQRPGPDESARKNLRQFVESGKGLALGEFGSARTQALANISTTRTCHSAWKSSDRTTRLLRA